MGWYTSWLLARAVESGDFLLASGFSWDVVSEVEMPLRIDWFEVGLDIVLSSSDGC